MTIQKEPKHIDIKVHFVKDLLDKGRISIDYIDSKNNLADVMTKGLCKEKFYKLTSPSSTQGPEDVPL